MLLLRGTATVDSAKVAILCAIIIFMQRGCCYGGSMSPAVAHRHIAPPTPSTSLSQRRIATTQRAFFVIRWRITMPLLRYAALINITYGCRRAAHHAAADKAAARDSFMRAGALRIADAAADIDAAAFRH